jgi:endonuclease G
MSAKRKKPAGKTRQPKARAPLFWVFVAVVAVATALFLYLPRDHEPLPVQPEQQEPAPETPPVEFERGHLLAGAPVDVSYPYDITVLRNTGYVAGYCDTRKGPVWVGYRLFDLPDNPETHKRLSRFKVDERTRARINHDDYTHSGYDRGHMAPSYGIDTRYGRTAQEETYLMSNITPQIPLLNRYAWKDLEMMVAKKWAEELEEVWVFTGPVYVGSRDTLESGVEIPDAFYKMVADETAGGFRVLCFLFPGKTAPDTPLDAFLVPVDSVEALTGLDFFEQWPDAWEQQLETQAAGGLW